MLVAMRTNLLHLASYSTFPNRKGFGESKETYVKEEVSE
jgi:hypothetical protein